MSLFTLVSRQITRPVLFVAALALLALVVPSGVLYAFDIGATIGAVLHSFVTAVFGWLVGLGALLLDYSINKLVIGFGGIYNDQGLGFTIDRLWVMVRDIFNLTFIFGLVFLGLKMIFDSGNSSTRRMIVSLIIAALLVNFSLLITKLVVDFSNIAAEQIVKAFPDAKPGEKAVAGSFMNIMGVKDVLEVGQKMESFEGFTGGGIFSYIIGTMFIYIIAAFVFFAGGLLLMVRFVALNLYMLLSPIMFLGMVFPAAASISRQYWTGFLSRAFVAPVFILLLYFAHEILGTFSLIKGNSSMGSIFAGKNVANTFGDVLPPFVLTAIFMVASLVIAQKMSNEGAGAAVALQNKMVSKVRSGVGAAALGTPAAALRATAGKVGNAATSNNNRFGRMINRNAQGKGLAAWSARRAQDVSSAAASSSFDVRQVAGFGKAAGLGEGKKGGFVKNMEERAKREKERAKKFAYNEQAYDDHFTVENGERVSMRREYEEYQELIAQRNRYFEEMARTADEGERMRLHQLVQNAQEGITAMESGNLTPVEQAQLNQQQQQQRQARLAEFNRARAAARANYGQRLYAANLASKYTTIPIVGGDWLRSQERTNAAEEIIKQAGQSPEEAFIRRFLQQQQNNPAPANP